MLFRLSVDRQYLTKKRITNLNPIFSVSQKYPSQSFQARSFLHTTFNIVRTPHGVLHKVHTHQAKNVPETQLWKREAYTSSQVHLLHHHVRVTISLAILQMSYTTPLIESDNHQNHT